MVSKVSRVWKPDETLALVFEIVHPPFKQPEPECLIGTINEKDGTLFIHKGMRSRKKRKNMPIFPFFFLLPTQQEENNSTT